MIALFSRSDSEWAECTREHLRDHGIPCALIGPEYGNASLAHRVPFVILSPDLPQTADSFRRQIPVRKLLTWSEDVPVLVAVREAYAREFGVHMDEIHEGGIRFVGEQVRFRGARLTLTRNERRILNLLIWCHGTWFSAEDIAALCLRSAAPGAAAVHICNINHKAQQKTNFKVIECRRFRGYRIP